MPPDNKNDRSTTGGMMVLVLLGWGLLIFALLAAAAAVHAMSDVDGLFISTYDLWHMLGPDNLVLAHNFVEREFALWLWDPVLLSLLALPGWLLFGVPGTAMVWFCRSRREPNSELQADEDSLNPSGELRMGDIVVADQQETEDRGSSFSILGRRPESAQEMINFDLSKRPLFIACATLCIAFIVWLNIGTLDIVSMTQGEVIPSSQVKSIQHLEGGIILEILVQEGQVVEKGLPLVVLEKTVFGADVAELRVRLGALAVELVRLEAESSGKKKLQFDEKLVVKDPELVRQALKRFDAIIKTQASKISIQRHLNQKRKYEIEEITARIENNKAALVLQDEQISISETLLKGEMASRYEHLDLLKQSNELKGLIKRDVAALRSARAALGEAKAQLTNIKNAYLEEVRGELDEKQLEYNELTERLKKFEDSLRRTVLRSPVDGIIKTLHVTTIGGVIKAGDKVVDIVPGEDRLVIEAKLPTQDIGYIQIGQTADVKLASADAPRFGSLNGVVTTISPDTLITDDGVPYYKVRVTTDRSFFERGAQRYQLFPGMQVMANIKTGKRTVFQYLFDPVMRGMGDALQER